jgi:3D (Asp-Asp-Asp) domain-containing protein
MKKLAILCLLTMGVLILPRPTLSVTMSIVTVTAYSYNGGAGPHGITASGRKVKEGMIAVSRDVERMLNLGFGDRVLLHGLGVYEFQDRMANRMSKKADVFMNSDGKARRFGVKRQVVLVKLV